LQTEVNFARKNLLVVLRCSCKQYYLRKANNIKLYGNMFTSAEKGFFQSALFFESLRKHLLWWMYDYIVT